MLRSKINLASNRTYCLFALGSCRRLPPSESERGCDRFRYSYANIVTPRTLVYEEEEEEEIITVNLIR